MKCDIKNLKFYHEILLHGIVYYENYHYFTSSRRLLLHVMIIACVLRHSYS